jgi:hypothetical protein
VTKIVSFTETVTICARQPLKSRMEKRMYVDRAVMIVESQPRLD